MKALLLKRLQQLEHAATVQGARQMALIEVMAMAEEDRAAYWSGDVAVLRRYGAPDQGQMLQGQIHTVVIDVHPACRDLRQDDDNHADADA